MGGDYIADYSAIKSLERDVILHVVELAGRFLGRRGGFLGRLGPPEGLRARLPRAGARAEHLHRIGHDLGAVAVLALLVLPLARADAPLDIDLRALLQVLARDFGQATEESNAVPFGCLLHFSARLVLPAIGGGEANVRNRVAARQILCLRVRTEITDQNYLVYRCHFTPPPLPVSVRSIHPIVPALPSGAQCPRAPALRPRARRAPRRALRAIPQD